MIKLKDYPKQANPVVIRVPYGTGHLLKYIGQVNACAVTGEPWEYLAWQRPFERGKPLPPAFAGRLPKDAKMGDAFLLSLYDARAVENILKDANQDPDIKKLLELREAEKRLYFELFPPET